LDSLLSEGAMPLLLSFVHPLDTTTLGNTRCPPINLRRIDLNLLTIFEATYEEGSRQKAAERIPFGDQAILY